MRLKAVLAVAFASAALLASPQVAIVENSPLRTVVDVTVPEPVMVPVTHDGEQFSQVTLPGEVFAALEEGRPEVPKVSVLLAIPTGARVSARAEVLETGKLAVDRVYPLQPPLLDGTARGPLVIDRGFYDRDAAWPGEDVRVVETGTWRDLDVANLQVYPVQVNPARGEVTWARKVRVTVDYTGGSYPQAVADWLVPHYAAYVDNFAQLGIGPETDYTDGVRYLVFCHQNYATNAWLHDSLLGWVKQRGYETRVITKSSFTAAEIKDSVKQEYDRHDPHLLRWVLLVGEQTEVPQGSYSGVGASDFYYSDLEPWPSGDNYPEICIGRLSPSSPTDLENQIKKILKYQKNPATTNDWLEKITLVAHDEQYPGKYSGCVRGVYNMPLPYYGYTRDTIMGQYLGNADVTSAVNGGSGIAVYRGHGDTQEWWEWCADGSWYNSHVDALSNGDLTPVTYHFACYNGQISTGTCHIEAWMRKYPGGAVSALSATQASYTYPNHGQCSTVVRCTGDTWTINVPGVRDYVGPIFDVAGVMYYMDAYIAKYWPGSVYPYNIYMYLTLGDPAMPVWSGGMPAYPTVTYSDSIPLGTYSFNVTVEVGADPVEGALVCAWREGEFYVSERTDASGLATLETNAATPGEVLVTVSEGHVRHSSPTGSHVPIYPHEGTTMAGGGGTPMPSMRYVSNEVDDSGGNGNGRFDPGETAQIIVTLRNAGNGDAENVTATLASDNGQFVIGDPNSVYGDVPAGSTRTNFSDRFEATAGSGIPGGTMVTCTLHVHADDPYDYDWTYTFDLQVGEPALPPGTVIWGPKICPAMPDSWGLYGVAYNTCDDNIYCLYFMNSLIYKYSSDSMLTSLGTIPAPEDSCTGIDYTDYDSNLWVVANPSRTVYKIDRTGTVLRSFTVPSIEYPCGITELEAEHTLYITDRRTSTGQPSRIFVLDTLGQVLDTIAHPRTGTYGSRCLALEWPLPADDLPNLLNMYTWFDGTGTVLDSCCMYRLDRETGALLDGYQFPNTAWNMRGIEYDFRDNTYWVTIMQWSTGNDNMILKVAGFTPPTGMYEETPAGPDRTVTVSARPNPFSRATVISAATPEAGPVALRVFDNNGRLVRKLEHEATDGGRVQFRWNGTDARGRTLAPGIYFYLVSSQSGNTWGKLVLSH